MKNTKYVLKRKTDGWYVSPGSKHTSDPASAMHLNYSDAAIRIWLATWGPDYEAVKLAEAKEIE